MPANFPVHPGVSARTGRWLAWPEVEARPINFDQFACPFALDTDQWEVPL